MDIIFNCSHCNQELEVDVTGAGTEIECPNCSETIVIPHVGTKGTRISGADSSGKIPVTTTATVHTPNPVSAMASSAAAKIEMHLKVPVGSKPTQSLITKPPPPLEVAAKESDKKLRVRTIRHTDCIEVGHDKFDEVVTQTLEKIGESNIHSITPMAYTHLDIGSQKLMTDYAVMIVYRG
jgi:DNA-directed RNA polymerase subunit RPC12/RpoP